MSSNPLSEQLNGTVAARSDAPAISDEAGTLTWTQFARHAEGWAAQLHRASVGRGRRVALWLPNSADYLAVIFATARLGASDLGAVLRRAGPACWSPISLLPAWILPAYSVSCPRRTAPRWPG